MAEDNEKLKYLCKMMWSLVLRGAILVIQWDFRLYIQKARTALKLL